MELGLADAPVTSRRQLRESQSPRRRSKPRRWRLDRSALVTWLPRSGVLVALATATIAVPVLQAAIPQFAGAGALAAVQYPSAYEVLVGFAATAPSTSALAAAPDASRVSDTASRSLERNPLPGCDGVARVTATNGQLPESDLCTLWDGVNQLRADAAVALAELDLNYRAAFGRDLCLTDTYRTLGAQRRVAATRGYLAATPGTSNHGWGLAIDLCRSDTRSEVLNWLTDNGRVYGWVNPPWAQRGGSGAYEPWHWEYLPGTQEMGTDYTH